MRLEHYHEQKMERLREAMRYEMADYAQKLEALNRAEREEARWHTT
jgi:hypothetical protein